MARNNFYSMVNNDGEVSLDELLMQIEQLQPVYQEPEVDYYAQQFAPDVFAEVPTQVYQPEPIQPTYQPEPVYQPVYQEPVYIAPEPVYQAPAPVYVAPEPVYQEPVYQPIFQQPEVQQPYVEPQSVQEVINQIATQLPPSVVNEIIARQPIEQPIQQDADAPVEQMVAPQTLLQTTEPTQKAQETKSTKPSDSVIESLTQQILGQGTSENWQGGVDAKTAAKDMAKIMAGIGITDIRQFGKIPDLVTAEVQYGVNGQVARQDEDGNYYIMAQGGTDSEGNQINYRQSVSEADLSPIYGYNKTIDGDGSTTFEAVDPSKVIVKDGVPRVQVGETYGNKETGQVVPNTYSERQTGNAFGGTFEGSGNTGYRVDFAPDGTPVFYTTKSSSNDLLNIMASNPVVNAVATYFAYQAGGPAGVAALNAAQGKDIKDVAKATLLTYLGNEVIAPYISQALPTPDVPIDFVEGTTEQINDALRENFVNDLKKAGVTNPSEFLNEIGLNATKFASQVTEPVVAPVVEPTVSQPIQPSIETPVAPIDTVAVTAPTPTPTINQVINAIVAQQPTITPVTEPTVTPVIEPPVTPIETVQVSAPVAPTPTINEVINAIVNQQPEVQVTAEQQPVAPTPVTPTVEEIVRTLTEPTPTPVAPVENVQVTAPVETTTPTVSEIINSIIQPVVTEPTVVEPVPQVVAPIETVQVTETVQPTAPTVSEVINAIAQIPVEQPPVQQAPTPVEVTAPREQVSPEIVNAVNAQIAANVAQPPAVEVTAPRVEAPKVEAPKTVEQVIAAIIPELVMTSQAPKEPEQPIPTIVAPPIQDTIPQITTIAERPSTITNETEPAPTIVAPPITETVPPKTYTTKEIIDMIRLGVLSANVLNAATQETGPTGFPIVPVPADWKSPTYTKDLPSVAPTQLPPIDFGNRNLLIGTQWEKFLDPNYGKVPAPIQFNQPSDMSYDRLMSILGTSRDVLPSQALSINDVISGIQNQYG